MYEIATLKTKKLPELQEIAKKIGIKKTAGLKKLDLIYQIVDLIASKPDENTDSKFDSTFILPIYSSVINEPLK